MRRLRLGLCRGDMRRLSLATVGLVLVASSCMDGGGSSQRTILVDYSSDRFASFFLYNFPTKIAVHPGTELVFRQTWTGEPHTVTGGTATSRLLAKTRPLLDLFVNYDYLANNNPGLPDPEDPGDATFNDFTEGLAKAQPKAKRDIVIDAWGKLRDQGVKLPPLDEPSDASFDEATKVIDELGESAFNDLPFAFGEETDDLNQAVAQPCYRRRGQLPKDPKKPCSEAQQRQPEFDGSEAFYNSGIIRYEGQQGNTFRVPLADDIKPGTYTFYCAVHGPLQATDVEVRPESEDVPSQEEVSRESRRQITEFARPLDEVYRDATDDGRITVDDRGEKKSVGAPFAGLFSPKEMHAAINAFVPERITVKTGEPIVWKLMGAEHTISFDVPTYFPPVEFLRNGTVRLNPKLDPPAGGAPPKPEDEVVTEIDGGTYDGSGFWSSGLIGACPECGDPPYIAYTLRISKPGSYKYACLLHPPMVGTVVVTD